MKGLIMQNIFNIYNPKTGTFVKTPVYRGLYRNKECLFVIDEKNNVIAINKNKKGIWSFDYTQNTGIVNEERKIDSWVMDKEGLTIEGLESSGSYAA